MDVDVFINIIEVGRHSREGTLDCEMSSCGPMRTIDTAAECITLHGHVKSSMMHVQQPLGESPGVVDLWFQTDIRF